MCSTAFYRGFKHESVSLPALPKTVKFNLNDDNQTDQINVNPYFRRWNRMKEIKMEIKDSFFPYIRKIQITIIKNNVVKPSNAPELCGYKVIKARNEIKLKTTIPNIVKRSCVKASYFSEHSFSHIKCIEWIVEWTVRK